MDFLGRFLEQAKIVPQKIAATDDGKELTYGQLASLSGSLSALLHDKGLPQRGAVGVLVPRTVEIVECALGVMRAGGIHVPMDSAYPSDRLSFMLKDSSACLLIATRELWEEKELDFPSDKVIFIDEFSGTDGRSFDAAPGPDDPSYLLYTSGTTGRPKGVVHTHRSLLAMASQFDGFMDTGVVAGFTFIASSFMMFPPLMAGGTCNIVPDSAKTDMTALNDYVGRRGIRQLFLPASLAAAMVEEFSLDGVTLFSAGEKLRNFKKKGGATVINAYGSTEGVVVLCADVKGDELDVPLGSPCKGITARIVDEKLREVAVGETGELIYSGDIMAQGYLGLDSQTAEKWFEADGRRWFRTGDRVRIGQDGFCHYVGRSDNMVKIRGFRVETGEVENCIRELQPAIVDLAVVLRTIHGIDHLCCYYNATVSVDASELKELVARRLAEYMVPDTWVCLADFPRNPNGKIMRDLLPAPRADLERLSALYSEVEMRVEEAARTVLGLDLPVDIDDSFLALGGDSLRAMKLASVLSDQGIRVTGSQVLRLKILRRIAEEAEVAYERLWTPEQYSQVKYRFSLWGEKILKVLPLTSGQDDMLFGELIYPDSSMNRIVYGLDVESSLTQEELSAAVDKTSSELEELRAAVVYQAVSTFQQVITDRKLPVRCIDLSDDPDQNKTIAELCHALKMAPVDLEQSAAMEVVYVRTGPCEGHLLFRVLHVSLGMDGVRRGISGIVKEILKIHPDDESLKDWLELLEAASENQPEPEHRSVSKVSQLAGGLAGDHEEMAVFSEAAPGQKKLVFVHTGNTGSSAYYQLADRIGGICGFSVIEPYNLYHPAEAIKGIKNIAAKYVEILRRHQSEGPYFLGGWCYGGVVAYEMACQLVAAGEKVEHLVMLDSHATVDPVSKKLFNTMSSFSNKDYFEHSPLFADLRAQGMLDALVKNSRRVSHDIAHHVPSVYDGEITYFKPTVTPSGIQGESLKYWQEMMKHKAGGYEAFCSHINIIPTPHEHDLMMDEESLAIIVPIITELINDN